MIWRPGGVRERLVELGLFDLHDFRFRRHGGQRVWLMDRNRWMSAYGQGGAEQTYLSSRLYTRPRKALSEKPEKTSPGTRGAHMSPCPPRCISIGPRRGLRKNQLGWRVRKMTEVRQERSVIVSARFMPVPRSIGHVPSSTCCLGRRFYLLRKRGSLSVDKSHRLHAMKLRQDPQEWRF